MPTNYVDISLQIQEEQRRQEEARRAKEEADRIAREAANKAAAANLYRPSGQPTITAPPPAPPVTPPKPVIIVAPPVSQVTIEAPAKATGVSPPPVKPWTDYIPEAKVNNQGQVTSMGFRKDIIIDKLKQAGASSDTVADFITKNPDVREGPHFIVDGLDKQGHSKPVVVDKKEYQDTEDIKSPGKKLDAYIKLGILPEGSKLIGNGSKEAVKQFNKEYNTNISEDFPYALPNVVSYTEMTIKEKLAFEKKLKSQPQYLQDAYSKGGIKGYNEAVNVYNTAIASANMLEKTLFNKDIASMPKEIQEAYAKGGIDAYNKAVEVYAQRVAGYNLAAGYLNESTRKEYQDALNAVKPYLSNDILTVGKKPGATSAQVTAEKEMKFLTGTKSLDMVKYLKDGNNPKYLLTLGITPEQIKGTKEYISVEKGHDKFIVNYFKEQGWDTTMPGRKDLGKEPSQAEIDTFQKRLDEADNKYFEIVGQGSRPGNIIKEMTLSMIPIYGTIRYAKKGGSAGWVAISAFLDVLIIVPIVGQLSAAARGTYLAGSAGKYLTAGVRAGEMAKATGRFAVSQFAAPFVILAHPVEALKAGISPIETALRPSKLPLSAIESKWNTMRIPIDMVGDEKTAIKLRDAVTDAAIHGRTAEVEINGVKVKIPPTAVNRLGEPVMISATQDIRPYIDGVIIGKGKAAILESGKTVIMGEGRDLYVSPTFHSRFAEATSTGMQIKDAIPGGLIIRDPAIIARLEKSGKVYAGTMEIEARLAASKNIDLGKPTQTLMTRTSYGKKLVLLVYGKPFTAAEIAEMKMIGSLDTVKQIFTAPIKVSKVSSTYNELAGMVASREEMLQEIARARKAGQVAELARTNANVARLGTSINRSYTKLQAEYRKVGLPIRTVMVRTTKPAREVSFKEMQRLLKSYRPVTKSELRAMKTAERRALSKVKERVTPRISPRGIVRETTRPPVRATTRTAIKTIPRGTIRVPVRETPRVPPRTPSRIQPRIPARTVPPTQQRPPVTTPRPPVTMPRTPTPSRPPVKVPTPKGRAIPKPPIPPRRGAGKSKEWTPEEIKSAIAWKDGFTVHAIRSPYRRGIDEKSYNIDHLPEGLKVMPSYTGKGSQQASARVTGAFPKKLTVDVGNQDVIISRQGGNHVSMRHVRDNTGTTSQNTIKKIGHSISQKRGKLYHSNTGGGLVISRRQIRGY